MRAAFKKAALINDEHIFLSFGKDLHGQLSCHLYMAFQLLQNMASGHVKVKKDTQSNICLLSVFSLRCALSWQINLRKTKFRFKYKMLFKDTCYRWP